MPRSRLPFFVLACAAILNGHALAQDDCSNAVFVTQGANGPFTNVGSTTSTPAWPCGAGGNDVWYAYVPPAAGSLTVDLCGSSYDTTLQIFDGTAGCGGASLGCNDDSCGLQSSLTITVAACTPYYIRVGGFNGATGTFTMNVNGPAGPACPGFASATPVGSGCGQQLASFYENFATSAAFDLANTCIQMTSAGGGFVVIPAGTYNPVGSLGTPTTLVLADDNSVPAGTLGITVHSNGIVSLGAGNSTAFTPSIPTMLSNPSSAYYSWHDLNPSIAGSGQVKYEEAGVLAQITYDGVWDFAGTSAASANFIQFQINTATGGAVICWGTMSGAGNGHLVGYSPGGPSLNPGNSDLSTLGTNPIVTSAADQGTLTLSPVGRPIQGAASVNFDVTTSNMPASAIMHLGIIGVSSPGISLAPIGAPTCFLNSSLDIILGPIVGPGPGTQTWTGINLPALPPSYTGFQFYLQSAILGTTQNAALGLGVLTSNGLLCTVGTF
jgi:hypothetical protein